MVESGKKVGREGVEEGEGGGERKSAHMYIFQQSLNKNRTIFTNYYLKEFFFLIFPAMSGA